MPKRTTTSPSSTTVSLRDLTTFATLSLDAWSRPSKSQPLVLSIDLSLPIFPPTPTPTPTQSSPSASTGYDTLATSFNYSTIATAITTRIQGQPFSDLEHVTQAIAEVAQAWPGRRLKVKVKAPKALVRGDGLERTVWMGRYEPTNISELKASGASGGDIDPVQSSIKTDTERGEGTPWRILKHEYALPSLRLACIIGLNPHERLEKQDVVFKIRFFLRVGKSDHYPLFPIDPVPSRSSPSPQGVVRRLANLIEMTSFQTIEALAACVAEWLLDQGDLEERRMVGGGEELREEEKSKMAEDSKPGDEQKAEKTRNSLKDLSGVSVRVEKPVAVTFAGGAGVEVFRIKGEASVGHEEKEVEEAFTRWLESKG